jgi:stearoyl-CoA desaturase (delta-9 desaturase)
MAGRAMTDGVTIRAGLMSSLRGAAARWIDSGVSHERAHSAEDDRIDWLRTLPFVLLHVSCLAVIWVGWSPIAVSVAAGLYVVRMLAITGFYHRYFSHRTFRTSRAMQFLFAVLGASAVQRGPLWWATHHRHHHAHSDQAPDAHSPQQHGFWHSHIAWFMTRGNHRTRHELVQDLARYPELRFLDRYDTLVPTLLAVTLFGAGLLLERFAPGLGTDGWQLLVWGFGISTVALYHATFMVNSLAHRLGRRRYATRDDSRNNFWLALLTCGEGWHNNHHHYPGSARQGFSWWEIDATWYFLKTLQALGLIWDVRPVPARIRAARRSTAEAPGREGTT